MFPWWAHCQERCTDSPWEQGMEPCEIPCAWPSPLEQGARYTQNRAALTPPLLFSDKNGFMLCSWRKARSWNCDAQEMLSPSASRFKRLHPPSTCSSIKAALLGTTAAKSGPTKEADLAFVVAVENRHCSTPQAPKSIKFASLTLQGSAFPLTKPSLQLPC